MRTFVAGPAGIKRLLPHRHPILLVDRVLELVPGERLTALKAVTGNEPWYRDVSEHAAEEDYDYPPALLIESWCQSAALLVARDAPNPDVLDGRVMLFGGMSGLNFTGRVRPGDAVVHEVRQIRAFDDTVIFEGRSSVGDDVVMEVGQAMIVLRPASELAAAAGAVSAQGRGGAHDGD
ncbi:beta-hydroxyacyl-ACP dehydratase [Streptomyces abikoensis]|uniref:3-hydroxyacyl-ACP dehydratase FabZ family protein n=1 Tax=Streptomyces abikoensis TaxID=97398 RepID=UPI00340F48F3